MRVWIEQIAKGKITMISLLITLLIGAFCGWLAGRIMGASKQGPIVDIILGLLGSVVGGWVIALASGDSLTDDNGLLGRIIVGTLGAVILIAVGRALMGRK